jgi:hypothetical protein
LIPAASEHAIHPRIQSIPRLATATIALAGAAWAAAAPPPGTPFIARTLLDHTLTPHDALVHRIDAGTITWTDSRNLTHTQPIADFLALLPGQGPTGWRADTALHTLALVDGQRFPGIPLPDADGAPEEDAPVAWLSDLTPLSAPLEAVASLSAPGTPAPAPDATGDDTIRLRNGDVLAGFILSLGRTIQIETGGGVRDVPLDLVAWARLANPPAPPSGPMLWLADGTVATVELLDQATPESLLVRPIPITDAHTPTEDSSNSASNGAGSGAHAVALAAVRALAFEPARLLPLGELPAPETTSERPWTPRVVLSDAANQPLGAPDITLPAPLRGVWTIPPTAARLAFRAVLPVRARTWGDCELVVTLEQDDGRTELSRTRLHAAAPTASINLELPAPSDPRRDRHLVIDLIAGPTGPAQDTLVLERPLLLLAP